MPALAKRLADSVIRSKPMTTRDVAPHFQGHTIKAYVLERRKAGATPKQIADELVEAGVSESVTPKSISVMTNRLRREGHDIPRASTRPEGPVRQREAEELLAKGLGNKQIAERLGISSDQVSVYRTKFNKKQPEGARVSSKGFRYGLPIASGGLGAAAASDFRERA